MNILVYWEQYSWGGTDTHLLNWARANEKLFGNQNKFIVLTNSQNPGFFRIQNELDILKNVHTAHFSLFSFFAFRDVLTQKIHNRILRKIFLFLGFGFFPVFLAIQFFQQYFQIRSIEKKVGKIGIAVSNNGAYPGAWGNIIFVLAAKAAQCEKIIMLVHHHATSSPGLRGIFAGFVDFLGLRLPDKIVAVSEATKNTIIEDRGFNHSEKIEVIFNGLDFDSLLPETAATEINFKERFSIPDGKKLVGILGVQEEYKGHDDLIKALGLLKKKKRTLDICLLIIGKEDPAEKERLVKHIVESNVERDVFFTGYLRESSYEIVKNLDLLAVATKDFEGFGLTLGEAMAVGTPVLATSVGAIPEFVLHQKNGFLVEPNNPVQIAQALENFLDYEDEWKSRAILAKDTIRKYSQDNMARNFNKTFIELLQNEK